MLRSNCFLLPGFSYYIPRFPGVLPLLLLPHWAMACLELVPRITFDAVHFSFFADGASGHGIGHLCTRSLSVQYHFPLFSFTGVHNISFRFSSHAIAYCALLIEASGVTWGVSVFVSFHTALPIFVIISLNFFCDDQAGGTGFGHLVFSFHGYFVLVLEQLLGKAG